eukprot:m.31139 g.31139  ORF g.31139 m.31139 type:complete len:451 (+) comp8283_c0_seq1:246-1598(+)
MAKPPDSGEGNLLIRETLEQLERIYKRIVEGEEKAIKLASETKVVRLSSESLHGFNSIEEDDGNREQLSSGSGGAQGEGLTKIPHDSITFKNKIGVGGFSTVWKGLWKDEVVAIKKLMTGMDDGGLGMQKLVAEAEILSRLSHRNIVQFRGISHDSDELCLLMEYAEGGSVKEFLRDNSLSPGRIVDWAHQVAKGMDYLHEGATECGSILHRDLKSANVLIASSKKVLKITDFGLSHPHEHTTRLQMGGTIAWMAPEAVRCTYSKGGDVWSFGVLLWEMLTGQEPFAGISVPTLAWLIASEERTLPIPESCPSYFHELLQQCWQRDHRKRISFAHIMLKLGTESIQGFCKTERQSFVQLQGAMQPEISRGVQSLLHQVNAKEAALNKTEQELKRKEEYIRLWEQAQEMTLKTSVSSSLRRRVSGQRKVSKSSISGPQPGTFRHISHLGTK